VRNREDYVELTKRNIKNFLMNAYTPSATEGVPEGSYKKGAHFAVINWKRYYYILRNYLTYKPESVEKILDIGAYPGTLSRIIRTYLKFGGELQAVGLNFTEEFTHIMREHNVTLHEVDVDPPYYTVENAPYGFTLPFADNYFDAVFACDIIEHLLNPRHLLHEIERALRPGGVFIVSTDNIADIGNVLNLMTGKTINQPLLQSHVYKNSLTSRKHVRIYTDYELHYLLKDAGFPFVKTFLYNIQHKMRSYTALKRMKYYFRNIFYLIPRYRPKLYAVCIKGDQPVVS